MAGRKTFSAEIDNAADVIAKEFKKINSNFWVTAATIFRSFR